MNTQLLALSIFVYSGFLFAHAILELANGEKGGGSNER